MTDTVTGDGLLGHYPRGESLSLGFYDGDIDVEAIKALEAGHDAVQVLGRSALGINGIDITQSERPIGHKKGIVHIPIEATAYTPQGEKLLSHLHGLTNRNNRGKLLRWDKTHHLPFGRLIHKAGLEQLFDDELEFALDNFLIAAGDFPDSKGDIEIEKGALSLPLEPWELVPNTNIAGLEKIDDLMPMLYRQSGRAFVFDNMHPEFRDEQHRFTGFMVGSVLLSLGPFYGQVVGITSPDGTSEQVGSAAWLDAQRSPGLHAEQKPGQRGRQVEIISQDRNHRWLDTRVVVKVFCPVDGADQTHINSWLNMSPEQRQDNHYFGYGDGV